MQSFGPALTGDIVRAFGPRLTGGVLLLVSQPWMDTLLTIVCLRMLDTDVGY